MNEPFISASIASLATAGSVTDLTNATSTLGDMRAGSMTPRGRTPTAHPSALSVMMSRQVEENRASKSDVSQSVTPAATQRVIRPDTPDGATEAHSMNGAVRDAEQLSRAHILVSDSISEESPLLRDVEAGRPTYMGNGTAQTPSTPQSPFGKGSFVGMVRKWRNQAFPASPAEVFRGVLVDSLRSLPAVVLGTLLNILDGVSCKSVSVSGDVNFHIMGPTRRDDHLSCFWRLHGSWRCGGIDVLCYVRVSELSIFLVHLTPSIELFCRSWYTLWVGVGLPVPMGV